MKGTVGDMISIVGSEIIPNFGKHKKGTVGDINCR